MEGFSRDYRGVDGTELARACGRLAQGSGGSAEPRARARLAMPRCHSSPGEDHGALGATWQGQQCLFVSTLCNLGWGKNSLGQWVTREAPCLCATLAEWAS